MKSNEGGEKGRSFLVYDRRTFLKGLGALGAAGVGTALLPGGLRAEGDSDDKTKFLIVLSAAGGASIIDGPMAIMASESANAATLNTFPDELVERFGDGGLRAVDLDRGSLGQIPSPFVSRQKYFIGKHQDDMMVTTWQRTSVNHAIGQRRSVTGNEAWRGRTLQEIVANAHGEGFAIPNAHLSAGTGYVERGTDGSLPNRVFGEPITDPALWPLALDGGRGLRRPIKRSLIERARKMRDERLDATSNFMKVFGEAPRIQHWRHIRGTPQESIEASDLISKLMLFPNSSQFPLSERGLESSPAAAAALEKFPNYASDPLEAQAALAFLLLRYRVSVTVTLGPSFDVVIDEDGRDAGYEQGGRLGRDRLLNPPIAFDFSHQGHRSVQGLMWDRMYRVADNLIDLLKGEEYANGESMWDRSMIYMATDFGRTKSRPANSNEFATGHNLNNGVVVLSPLVNGGRVLGGVDPDTALTYGFDPTTGAPDPGRQMTEPEVFAGLLHALDVDTTGSGLPDMRAMRKA
jgi:hypothetical protein